MAIHTKENFMVAMSAGFTNDSGIKCNTIIGHHARKNETITNNVTTKF